MNLGISLLPPAALRSRMNIICDADEGQPRQAGYQRDSHPLSPPFSRQDRKHQRNTQYCRDRVADHLEWKRPACLANPRPSEREVSDKDDEPREQAAEQCDAK